MIDNKITRTHSSTDYMGYALYAFGGLGIELLLMMIETKLYGQTSATWSVMKHIIHWTITCFIWGCLGKMLVKQLPAIPENKIKEKNIILAIIIISVSIIYTSLMWEGLKPTIELSTLGVPKFIFQYIYYAFESLLMMLIIAHGQKAFENWFSNIKVIPFGGIVLALTWGLVHIFTQGFSTGIYTVIQALFFGSVYIALNQNYKIAYVVIALMFML